MIKENLAAVRENIAVAAKKRTADMDKDILLVAVTKNHTIDEMREAIANGANTVGENRVQEAMEKYAVLGKCVRWHLIGHLQTNKVKHAVEIFDMIESVDSVKLAKAIDKEAAALDKLQEILVQVNLVKEASKTGIYLEDLPELLAQIDQLSHLKLKGLMFIAPNTDLPAVKPMFAQMYDLFQQTKKDALPNADIEYLSMGMTHDYETAVEAGANIVRVGTAIFGPRQY